MNKKVLLLSKIVGLVLFYSLILIASVFLTMSILIKGDEIISPDLTGKSLREAYEIAAKKGIYLKKIVGNFDSHYKPLTVINQVPAAGIRIKEKSFIKVFITSEVVEVIVPDLSGYNISASEKLLRENDLKKRYVTYMDAGDVPVDFVIAQSYPPGMRAASGTEIDILASRGPREKAFIMPDIIGKKAANVLVYFESMGLKIAKITKTRYPGLEPNVVIKQYPLSGYRINAKARVSIEVSE